jgi:hypothetical protein
MQKKTGPHFRPDPTSVQVPMRPLPRSATLAGADTRTADSWSQIASERSRREGRTTTRPRILTRQSFTWVAGASVVLLAFVITLWLTSPKPPAPGVATLTNATVSDATSLMAAVQIAGLRGTPDVKGAIEEIKRLDDERVMIKGWAVDATLSGPPLTVIAFAGGAHVLTVATNGARMDVAHILGLSDTGAANASFQSTFACRLGDKIVVVAVTSDHRYSQFRSLVCP